MRAQFKLLNERAKIPTYNKEDDVGMDLYSLDKRTLEQGEPFIFKLGLACEFEKGYVALIQDRSSMGARGVRVLGGVIDPGYRGEWGVILVNTTENEILINPGDKIAQVLFMPVVRADVETSESLSKSDRGTGGFGSSGK